MSNNLYVFAEIILALGVIIGGAWALLKWAYKRGGSERQYSDALDRNTAATEKLTEGLDKVVGQLNTHEKRLDRQDWRLDRLEANPGVNINVAPAHRDSSPE